MSQSYIRIARTPDVEKVLSDLRARFSLLNEAEIIKYALSEAHNKELEDMEKEQKIKEAYNRAIEEGGKVGDKILVKKGVKRENMSEQQLYDAVFKKSKRSPAQNRR
jgi:precorrin-4 methylase